MQTVKFESPEVLDLCTRKRPHSPDHDSPNSSAIYDSRIGQYSPLSNSDSESIEISSTNSKSSCKKPCRPFKAFLKDPLTLAQELVSTEILFQKESTQAFDEFRAKVLSQHKNTSNETNTNMRRTSNGPKNSDPVYWEKRRKNNEAAKRSRDARRAKEDEIAIRCAFLERENCHLKFLTQTLKEELEKLQGMVYMRNY